MSRQLFERAKRVCPHLPWCQDDPALIGQVIMAFTYENDGYFRRWAQKWFENFQFVYGNHDLRWSRLWGMAFETDFLRTERQKAINRKAQSNFARQVLESLTSFIFGNMPTFSAETPDQGSLEGERNAKISGKLLDAYAYRLKLQNDFKAAAAMYCTFGQVASKVDWNPRGGQMQAIPQYQRQQMPVFGDAMKDASPFGLLETPQQLIGEDGMPMMDDRWEPIKGPDGRQEMKWSFMGDPRVTMLNPMEYRREIGSHSMGKSRYVQQIRLMDYDEFIYEYSHLDGQLPAFKEISPSHPDTHLMSFALRHFLRLHFTTPPTLRDAYRRIEAIVRGNIFRHRVLVLEHYDAPLEDMWPYGRRVIVVNGKATHITIPDYQANTMGGWHPFQEAQWLVIQPSSMATGPMNDVIEKNRELNIADSLIATSMQRNMGSHLLIQSGRGIDQDQFTGTPGEIISVTGAPAEAAMWLHDSQPIPQAVFNIREMMKGDMYELSGAMEALRGERTKGVSAGYALRQLQEREQARLIPARQTFADEIVGGSGQKLLACIRHNVQRMDNQLIGYLQRNAAGEFDTHDVITFMSKPLDYGIDIKVDSESLQVRSKGTYQANLMELAKLNPVQQRLAQDAGVLDEFLKAFDADKLRDKSADHRDRAKKENEIFRDIARLGPDKIGLQLPVVLFEDDDNVHIAIHTTELLQNYYTLSQNPWALRTMIMHQEMHRMQIKEKGAEVPPGTTMQVPGFYGKIMGNQMPPLQQVAQEKQQIDQTRMQQAQQQQAQQQRQGPPGQAPKQATAPGQPAQPNPAAPAAQTPQGAPSRRGGIAA